MFISFYWTSHKQLFLSEIKIQTFSNMIEEKEQMAFPPKLDHLGSSSSWMPFCMAYHHILDFPD